MPGGELTLWFSFSASLGRTVGPTGPFFPSCLPGTLLNTATYAQALSHVASLKGESGLGWPAPPPRGLWILFLVWPILAPGAGAAPFLLLSGSARVANSIPLHTCCLA